MAVTATAGIFGFGHQPGAGVKQTLPVTVTSWYRHKAADMDLAIVDDVRLGPPEIGGTPTPSFPYKAGYLVTGGATIYPRLKEVFGHLLLGAMGKDTITADEDVEGNAVTGLTSHAFTYDTVEGFVPHMAFRKLVPHPTAANQLGESYYNCKVTGLGINLPNDGPISTRVDVQGMDFVMDDNPSWTWANTYEDYQSIPISVATGGFLKFTPLGGSLINLPVVSMQIQIQNTPLDIRQEKIFGSPKLEDVTIIQRSMTFEAIVKYSDPQLYLNLLTGSTTGTEWTVSPFTGELDILCVASRNISATAPLNIPWKMRIQAPEVQLQQVGGIRLAANQTIMMRFQGTALAPSTGSYATITMHNERATAYALPA